MGNGAAVQGSAAQAAGGGVSPSGRSSKSKSSWKAFTDSVKKSLKLRRDPPPRREIITTAEGVLADEEALQKVLAAVEKHPPGQPGRWSQIIQLIAESPEPTEEEPDPLRVRLDLDTLVELLFRRYNEMRTIANSEGLALAREYIPRMYDKHSLQRGTKVSQREREERGLTDECYAYGGE